MSDVFDSIINYPSITSYADKKCVDYLGINKEQTSLCEEIKLYRDSVVFEDYNKAFDRYLIKVQGLNNLQKVKDDLINDTRWQLSNAGYGFGQLMVVLNRTCHLIEILVPVNKANKAFLESYKLYKLYRKYGRKLEDFGKTGETHFFKIDSKTQEYLDLFNTIKQTATEIKEMVSEFEKQDKGWRDFKETIKQEVVKLDKMITNYNVKVETDKQSFIEKSDLIRYLDNYIESNCNSTNKP